MVSFVVALIALGAGVIALTRVGSLTKAFGLEGSNFSGDEQKAKSGEVTTDVLQANPSIPIPQGSQNTVATIQSAQIIRTDVASKRKFDQGSSKPVIRTTFFNPNEGGSEPQAGVLLTSNNSLRNTVLGLNQKEVDQIRAQPFTKQELSDITALTTRFNRKSSASQKVSDSPQEIVFKKREQEAIAIKILGGLTKQNFPVSGVRAGIQVETGGIDFSRIDRGLTPRGFSLGGGDPKGGFRANPAFALGGITPEEFTRQRIEKEAIFAKQAQNLVLQQQRQETGTQILSTIAKSGMNQKQFLLSAGIALRGSDLNAKAIAKLRERGLI